MNIKNINKTIIDSSIEDQSEGDHNITWNGNDSNNNCVNSGVYFCSMKTIENDDLIYQDEIMMYLLTLNYDHKNGSTNSEGIFESTNMKPFVNLYDLDSLQVVDSNGEIIGLEAFSDTTAICLFDENTNNIRQFEYAVLRNGVNVFDITWNPEILHKSIVKEQSETDNKGVGDNVVPGETSLLGNYPNPFN